MSDKDFAIGAVGIPNVGAINKKPAYLITLIGFPNAKYGEKFIAFDRPDSANGLLQVKGVYSEQAEDDIVAKFSDIVSSTPKEKILDMMFPLHRIISVRSLVFNANKTQTLVR